MVMRPINETGRLPLQGRIRMGEKNNKGWPTSIETFIFTSPDRAPIECLAELYGGEVESGWNEGSIKNQYKVKTNASTIRVYVPPDAVSTSYELWDGPRRQRICDAVEVQLRGIVSDDGDLLDNIMPCICNAQGVRECSPKTRLQVILPEVQPFGGMWRLDTSSWEALETLPGMAKVLELVQHKSPADGKLSIRTESKADYDKDGKKITKKFVRPVLTIGVSMIELEAQQTRSTPALESPEIIPAELPVPEQAADEIEEAVIVEDGWDRLTDVPKGVNVVKNPKPDGFKYVKAG